MSFYLSLDKVHSFTSQPQQVQWNLTVHTSQCHTAHWIDPVSAATAMLQGSPSTESSPKVAQTHRLKLDQQPV